MTSMTTRNGTTKNAAIGKENAVKTDMPVLYPARIVEGFSLPATMIDVRGWKVITSAGEEVGVVDGLMVDGKEEGVRWIALALNETLRRRLPENDPSTVLVPVGRVRHMGGHKTLVLEAIGVEHLLGVPRMAAGKTVARDVEDATLKGFGMATSKDLPLNELYSGPGFDLGRGLMAHTTDQQA